MQYLKYAKLCYFSFIEPITTRLSIHKTIHEWYWKIKIVQNPIEQKEIAGTTVQFNITNRTEYGRHRNLGGETKILKDLLSELKPDDVVYDIGANVGTYTCFLAKRLNPSNVVAFEPHPSNVKSLRSNLELNNTDATIIQKALSDTAGSAKLGVESKKAGEGSHSLVADDNQTIEVEVATGDQLINNGKIPAPTVLKIDVEGAESQVLRGLKETLKNGECRLCYVEVHPDRLMNGEAPKEIEEFLESLDYEVSVFRDRGSEYFVKAIRHQSETTT